jgi:hypothetical protein
MRVHARTSKGEITITASEANKRTFEWDGCKKNVSLWSRDEPWHGMDGLYYPGPGRTWWFGCDGVDRAVIEESKIFFDDESGFIEYIHRHKDPPYVYRNDGLVVGFGVYPKRDSLNVDVFQAYVGGRKPKHLNGADDGNIDLVGGEVADAQ